ncbi:hypothetical protein A3F57_05425 [Candidatus Roizmanbacteria bacterium RIFCSPHIGHO2_12_FULL_36_11]|nr:MAG: hypothetical protein A3F57_05425 [Candidatus Roizmanbacteria bacterium RIFCSPHIGHO2_12_FULL_36_11]
MTAQRLSDRWIGVTFDLILKIYSLFLNKSIRLYTPLSKKETRVFKTRDNLFKTLIVGLALPSSIRAKYVLSISDNKANCS